MMRATTIILMTAFMSAACGDKRATTVQPSGTPAGVRTSDLSAGLTPPDTTTEGPFTSESEKGAALRDGAQLYVSMNCAGCHGGKGGGGIGPPLSDARWIYGHRLENIVQTVLQGRPNGMPSYAHKLPQREVWKIAMFVQSFSHALPEAKE
ncbi:MAG: c-type cytochrome [Phycisphaerae bacterium]|nr:c-type cytochrome [Gemmatimonadaceae bacterium]